MGEVFDVFRAKVVQMMDNEFIWVRCGGGLARFNLPLNYLWVERGDVIEWMVWSYLAFKTEEGSI